MKKLVKLIIFIVAMYVFLQVNNKWLMVTEHVYESERVPASFDGYRITQVTDLHDAIFGKGQRRLIEKVRATNPDVIFITGDLIDSNRYHLENSLDAVRGFVDIADVYYVLGNHEVATRKMQEIYEVLIELGVHVLPNRALTIKNGDEQIVIAGIEDPLMGYTTQEMLDMAYKYVPSDAFTLLLSHRPERFETYVNNAIDVVFTGHAHGGQIRLPFIGGLVAPGQGYLPKYTAGTYEDGETTMVVSRGLGNSVVPYRIFNLPEIVTVELRATK
ncbi:metallophosphoesterase [Metasolibacillus sp. FSL H7-0170]|uniref:metallophosphoesterase n=1 Tax=Metasolibacillus TaxID=2703677 RepID=UPI000796F5CB|nr:metallophosphoesterase [Metasolibacillus fluoroglycofenilyticus]KYG89265.1 phosphoesterase [[Bacillus] sp. KCTC 13219]